MPSQRDERDIPSLSQFVDTSSYTTTRNLGEFVGEEIVILDVDFNKSRYSEKNYAILTVSVGGETITATTGVQSIVRLLEKVASRLPVRARVVRDGRYYRLE